MHEWALEGDWKLAAEQFGTAWYHVNLSQAALRARGGALARIARA